MKTGHFELAEARTDGMLNIGRGCEASGVSVEMIRHHAASRLPLAAGRAVHGCRIHRHGDAQRLTAHTCSSLTRSPANCRRNATRSRTGRRIECCPE